MCGIVGVIGKNHQVNQLLYDALLLLQHRGQSAAGIATMQGDSFCIKKDNGLVQDVFREYNISNLLGNAGIGQVRYPTSGSRNNQAEAQPFYVNSPFGLVLSHNGNLTNVIDLKKDMLYQARRHINTKSDSEVLLNVLADELQKVTNSNVLLNERSIFHAVIQVQKRLKGSYAVVSLIAGYGLLAFRDPFGIRPLCIGQLKTKHGKEWLIASESAAVEGLGFTFIRDINPGEAIFIDMNNNFKSYQCTKEFVLHPCVFEYVYFARPDSCIDGVSVYNARLLMGDYLAKKIAKETSVNDIDVVMPIPDSSRPAAMQVAKCLNIPYREGFSKNRYIGRTFIMTEQAIRRKSVQQKLNTINFEFKNKKVLIIDDSIVRGTTSYEIIQMAKQAGAKKVIFASAAPPVLFPNVYGIDMPTRTELIAHGRTHTQITQLIGADQLIYQDLKDLKRSIQDINKEIKEFDTSCFDGKYITGNITESYLNSLESNRNG